MKDLEFVSTKGNSLVLKSPGAYFRWIVTPRVFPTPGTSVRVFGQAMNTPKLRQFLRRALARLERDAEKRRGKK